MNKNLRVDIKPIIVGLLAWLFSFFLYSPRFILFLGLGSGTTRRDNLLMQCFDPFSRNLIGLEKTQLYSRIVQPIIANFLGWCGERRDFLAIMGSPGIAYIALILTLSFFCFSISKRFSKGIAISSTFAISTTMVTQWTNTHWGHSDSLTFLPIAILLCFKKWWIIVLCTFIGCLNDERFVLAIPFLILWWWPDKIKINRELILKLFKISCCFSLGLLIFIVIRVFLSSGLIGPGIDGEGSMLKYLLLDFGLNTILNPSKWFAFLFVAFFTYRWLWFMPLMAVMIMFKKERSFKFIFFVASIVATLFASTINADTSRTIAFAFPVIPFSLSVIYEQFGRNSSRVIKLLNLLTFINILTPAGKVYTVPSNWLTTNPLNWFTPALPLPVNLWRWFTSPNGYVTW